jgi:hypothetical protein
VPPAGVGHVAREAARDVERARLGPQVALGRCACVLSVPSRPAIGSSRDMRNHSLRAALRSNGRQRAVSRSS